MATSSPQLDHVITDIKRRFGAYIIRPLRTVHTSQQRSISTGFEPLDRLLPFGGLPVGDVTQISKAAGGLHTSGAATLALQTAAQAQAYQDVVIFIDRQGTFDSDYAAHCGLDLDHALVIQSPHDLQALSIANDLLQVARLGAVVIDGIHDIRHAHRLRRSAQQTSTLVMLLAPETITQAGLSLTIEHSGWTWQDGHITGYQSQVCIARSRYGRVGDCARINIHLDPIQVRGWL